jgi:hypothetical protein
MPRLAPISFVDAEQWRKLAGAARSKATRITNAQTRKMVLNLAQTYDRLAEQADCEKPPGDEPSG